MQEATKLVGNHQGVWIDMLLEKEPFYIFVTQ